MQPSRARRPSKATSSDPAQAIADKPGRRVSKHPLIVVAQRAQERRCAGEFEKWKLKHPTVVEHLQPADILTDSMRGRSSTWRRIRINLQHVPEELRPKQEDVKEPSEPWADATPEQIAAYREMHRKRRQVRKAE